MVKAFARQTYEREKFERDNWQKFLRGRRLLQIHALYWPSSDLLCGAQMLAGFTVGALMAINGAITVGTYLAYTGLIIWIIWPMQNMGRLIVQTSMGLVSYQRISETFVLDEQMRRRLAALNPQASVRMANRLLEASDRKYWHPDDATLAALQDAADDLEDRMEGIAAE